MTTQTKTWNSNDYCARCQKFQPHVMTAKPYNAPPDVGIEFGTHVQQSCKCNECGFSGKFLRSVRNLNKEFAT